MIKQFCFLLPHYHFLVESPPPTGTPTLTRRKVIQIGAAAGVLGAATYFGFGPKTQLAAVRHSQPLMGTVLNMTVCGPDKQAARNAVDACTKRMETLAAMMSIYVPDSPISQLNRNGIFKNPPDELLTVLKMSRGISDITDGAFDPTVMPLVGMFKEVKKTGRLPAEEKIQAALQLVNYKNIVIEKDRTIHFTVKGTEITLDGIAKGYIVDQGIAVLASHGFKNDYVEAGGDLMTLGHRQDGNPWRIGIRNPEATI